MTLGGMSEAYTLSPPSSDALEIEEYYLKITRGSEFRTSMHSNALVTTYCVSFDAENSIIDRVCDDGNAAILKTYYLCEQATSVCTYECMFTMATPEQVPGSGRAR